MEINEAKFKVIVKAGSNANKIEGYDAGKKAYLVSIKEPADKDKANKELLRFLKSVLKKEVLIKSGLRSKEKIIEVKI